MRTHNPDTPAKPLADRLRPLFLKPVSDNDEQAIKHLETVISAGPSRRHELPAALLAIKPPLLEAGKWTRAMDEIGIALRCCGRTVDRILPALSDRAGTDRADEPKSSGALCPDAQPDEVTAGCAEIAAGRVGRQLTFHRRAETVDEFITRSLHEARKHYPPTKTGPHAGAVGYMLAQAANLGITAADLSKMLAN